MAILIGRPINGVTINGNEYVCDGEGFAIAFPNEQAAIAFLKENGMTEEEIETEGIMFEEAGDEDEGE